MDKIVGGLVLLNDLDIWEEWGAFLAESTRGGMENLTAILTPSELKEETAVDIREEDGEKYSAALTPRSKARDVTLLFALVADSRAAWMERYADFVETLKRGEDGWLRMEFKQLGLTLRLRYVGCTQFKPLTCLWSEGAKVYAGRFKVKFREPSPSF